MATTMSEAEQTERIELFKKLSTKVKENSFKPKLNDLQHNVNLINSILKEIRNSSIKLNDFKDSIFNYIKSTYTKSHFTNDKYFEFAFHKSFENDDDNIRDTIKLINEMKEENIVDNKIHNIFSELLKGVTDPSDTEISTIPDDKIEEEWNDIKLKISGKGKSQLRKYAFDNYVYNGFCYGESTLKRACRLLFEGYEKRPSLHSKSQDVLELLNECINNVFNQTAREYFFEDTKYVSEEKVLEQLLSGFRKDQDYSKYNLRYFNILDEANVDDVIEKFQLRIKDGLLFRELIKGNQNITSNKYELKSAFLYKYGIPNISLAIQLLDRLTGKQDEGTPLKEGMDKDIEFYKLVYQKYKINRVGALKIKHIYPMTKEKWQNLLTKIGFKTLKKTGNMIIKNRFADELRKMVRLPGNL